MLPPSRYKRRGLFRRRQAAPVAPEAIASDDEAVEADEFAADESDHTESEDAEPELVGNGHAWSYVPESTAAEDTASESSDAYAIERDRGRGHHRDTRPPSPSPRIPSTTTPIAGRQAAALIEAEDAPAGRTSAAVSSGAGRARRESAISRRPPMDDDVQLENSENSEPELRVEPALAPTATEFVGNGHAWSYIPESIEAEDTAFDSADTYEADETVAEYARHPRTSRERSDRVRGDCRGGDRRRSRRVDRDRRVPRGRAQAARSLPAPRPVALADRGRGRSRHAEDVDVGEEPGDEAGAIEDEGFENVPMYGTDSTLRSDSRPGGGADEDRRATQYDDARRVRAERDRRL